MGLGPQIANLCSQVGQLMHGLPFREAAFSHLHLMRMNAKDTVNNNNNSRAPGTLDEKSMGSCAFMTLQQGHIRFVSPRTHTMYKMDLLYKFKNGRPHYSTGTKRLVSSTLAELPTTY